MKNSAQITAAALIAAATTFANAGSLELDRSYASELKADAGARSVLNQGNLGNLEVSAGVQFSYAFNTRDGNGDDDDTMGFGFNEARIAIEGDVTDNMRARVSFDFGPNDSDNSDQGSAQLEDAYVDWAVNDSFSLRIGQYTPSFSAGASTDDFHTTAAYRSVTEQFIGNPTWTQGIEASWGGDTWGLNVGFIDGPNTGSTAFNSSAEQDYAFNARFDIYSDSNKARFDDQSSWRGSEAGWRLGAGAIYATSGDTNPSGTEVDTLWYTVDVAYEADGWALWGAFWGNDIDPDGGTSHTNFGLEFGGSFFFSDQWEGFARWDTLMLDDDAGAGQTSGEDSLNFLAVGVNYYFVPESQAAKLTLQMGASFEETADITNTAGDTGVNPFSNGTGTGFLQDAAGEDGQFYFAAMMQWLF